MKTSLSEIAKIQLGYQSRTSIQETPGGSHALVQARDLNQETGIAWDRLMRINPETSTAKNEIRQGDILFLARGQSNFACMVDQNIRATLVANSIYILRTMTRIILPEYLAWWLNQPPAQTRFEMLRSSRSMPYVSASLLGETEVQVPPIQEQEIIVQVDRLQQQEINLVQQLAEKRAALIHAYLQTSEE